MFKMAMTPVPLTTPAHSSMLTGMYPPAHGVHLNTFDRLADSNVTLATILRNSGYQTAAFVEAFPLDSRLGSTRASTFMTHALPIRAIRAHRTTFGTGGLGRINRPALAWLKSTPREAISLLFLHYYDVHHPYQPHPPFTSVFSDDPYAGEMTYVDHCIGQIEERLRGLGLCSNTLVIITADHGEGLGEHGEKAHSLFIYQSSLHVPLVIRTGLPQRRSGGQQRKPGRYRAHGAGSAWFGKAGRRARSEPPRSARRGTTRSRRPIYSESLEAATFSCCPLHSIIEGTWKYILAPERSFMTWAATQVSGRISSAGSRKWPRSSTGRLKEEMMKNVDAAAPRRRSTIDLEAVKRLQSLGYVSAGATQPASTLDAIGEDPKDFLPVYERIQNARGLFTVEHRNADAEKEMLEIAASRPRLIEPHRLTGNIALDEPPADAAVHYAKVVEILGETENSTKQPPAAMDDIAMATSILMAIESMGNIQEAIKHYEQGLEIMPGFVDAQASTWAFLLWPPAEHGKQSGTTSGPWS